MVETAVVDNIAGLAKIAMSDEQKKEMVKSFTETLDFVSELENINTDDVKPTTYMVATHDVLRDDIPGIELTQEEVLSNAPNAKKGHFAVPKVIG